MDRSTLHIDVMCLQITERYHGITRGYIQAFTNSCPTCKLAKPQKTRPPPKLNLVLEKDFLARVEVSVSCYSVRDVTSVQI